MKHYNAEVVLTPAEDFIAGAVEKAREIAKRPRHWAPRQFDNLDNVAAHEETTAQEILKQVPRGKVDAFVAARVCSLQANQHPKGGESDKVDRR